MYPYKVVLTDGVYEFGVYDYGRSIPFALYNQNDQAFNATGYAAYVRIFDQDGNEAVAEISPIWTAQSSGTGTFGLTAANRISESKCYNLELQLEKAGQVLSFRCVRPLTFFCGPGSPRTP